MHSAAPQNDAQHTPPQPPHLVPGERVHDFAVEPAADPVAVVGAAAGLDVHARPRRASLGQAALVPGAVGEHDQAPAVRLAAAHFAVVGFAVWRGDAVLAIGQALWKALERHEDAPYHLRAGDRAGAGPVGAGARQGAVVGHRAPARPGPGWEPTATARLAASQTYARRCWRLGMHQIPP